MSTAAAHAIPAPIASTTSNSTPAKPTTTEPDKKPKPRKPRPFSTASARMRRWRKRRQSGVQMVMIEVSQKTIENLIFTRHLKAEQAGDTTAIARAIERMLGR